MKPKFVWAREMTFLVIPIGMESFDPAVHPHTCNLSQILLSVTSLLHTLDQSSSKYKSVTYFSFSQNLLYRLLGCCRNQSVSHNLPVLNTPNKFKEGWDTVAKECTDFQDLHQETWRKLEQNEGWHPQGLSSSDKFPDLRKSNSTAQSEGTAG